MNHRSPVIVMQNAVEAAKKAVHFETTGELRVSAYYYEAAALLLEQVAVLVPTQRLSLNSKARMYRFRGDSLRDPIPEKSEIIEKDENKATLKQCHFLLQQAIEEDEHGDKENAIELYAKAVEYVSKFPDLIESTLKRVTMQALERAEELKGIRKEQPTTSSDPSSPTLPSSPEYQKPTTSLSPKQKPDLHTRTNAHLQVSGQDTYSEEEKLVLLHTSKINRIDFVPFMSIDLAERFQYSIPFSDQNGHLSLSPKQKKDFFKFARLEELCTDPCIVYGSAPDYFNIKQTVISDCSFVASLAVSAFYEKRFRKKLVTDIIYPQSKEKEKPLYNPFGKYMVKLHINGIARKVIIDDSLPVDKYGRLLCSYSSRKNEFWVSLLEKAYMKVMGGYDFPGSNSNIDLHALTGWIPERTAIRPDDADFNKNSFFDGLEARMKKGDVLVTVATGELSELQVLRNGLVPTHAYAVLDTRKVKDIRLLKLKNPWSHLRWRGNYSELDTKNWSPELQCILNYDPNSAAQFDNGIFWIDYESVCHFFDVFYMNWNPELFKFTYCIHQSWHAGTGPAKDLYSVASNPQFSLEVDEKVSGAVWLLLTRHIVDIADFRENKEYITLFVYKNGKKVYYPYDPPPYIDGVKINSPHYLCKVIIGPEDARKYTVVVSQYEKSTTIYYTLRAYASCPFTLTKIGNPYIHEKEITGEWKGPSAGGCPNHASTYPNNPKYKIDIESSSNNNQILIELKGPRQYQLGVEATIMQVKDDTITAPFRSKSSGSYRSGYVILELENIPAGSLKLVPSTFLPNQEGPFILVVKSSCTFQLSRI